MYTSIMNGIVSTFLLKFTFQRQIGITIVLGIVMLALFTSVMGSWQANERVRNNLLEQGLHITESLARQSTLALIYASADNASDAVNAALDFPGVLSVVISDTKLLVLLKKGKFDNTEFSTPIDQTGKTGKSAALPGAAFLEAESQNSWRFVAPVYSQPASSPFNEVATPELLGHVTVVVSKAALTRMTTSIFVANLITSFSFALFFLLLIRWLVNRMTLPLNQLSSSMGRAEAGETQVRAELEGPKDIADMAHSFNSMMAVLEERAAEIKQLNAELEQRVSDRTSLLEAANRELEAFSYSVSHDLRTPLRAIDGFSHILLDDYADKLDEEGKRLLTVVRSNTGRMGQLIDDMLKFSRTGRVELTLTDIDMQGLVRAVIEELLPLQDNSTLQMEVEAIPAAKGDRAMMRQVFVNLLSNAIKFTHLKEDAKIKVGGYIEGAESVYYVKDNGVGFDMKYADKLFGVFQRLHGVTEFEGTGIGLAIVKRVIVRHGGRVWAEGKINEGATIYFALPTEENNHE